MGNLNARIGLSDKHLRAGGRYVYHQVCNDNGKILIDLYKADDMCLATTRKHHPNRHK